jgi:hypothetical protein
LTGVRISWLIVARKPLFAVLAASACARARRSPPPAASRRRVGGPLRGQVARELREAEQLRRRVPQAP